MRRFLRVDVSMTILGMVMVPWIAFAATTDCASSSESNRVGNTKQTTPSSQFIISTDGRSVVDTVTGLMWDRCTVGYNYDSVNSTGCNINLSATRAFSWSSALNKAQTLNTENYQGHNDWRVPTYKELSSIVERACKNPSVNWTIFPNTNSGPYWTSTPVPKLPGAQELQPVFRAFVVTFIDLHLGDSAPYMPIDGMIRTIDRDLSLGKNASGVELFGAWLRVVRTCNFNNSAGVCR